MTWLLIFLVPSNSYGVIVTPFTAQFTTQSICNDAGIATANELKKFNSIDPHWVCVRNQP